MVGELPKSMSPFPEGQPDIEALRNKVLEKIEKFDLNTSKKVARRLSLFAPNIPIEKSEEELKRILREHTNEAKTITAIEAIDNVIENIDNDK